MGDNEDLDAVFVGSTYDDVGEKWLTWIAEGDERTYAEKYIRASVVEERIAERDAKHAAIIEHWKIEEQMWRDTDKAQLARIAELEAAAMDLVDASLSVIESAQSRYDLAALKRCADDATSDAEMEIGRFSGEAINWGDLGCTGAEYYINDYDSTGYRVIIEEAAPDACKLQAFVREYLAKNGFVDVDVVTEW